VTLYPFNVIISNNDRVTEQLERNVVWAHYLRMRGAHHVVFLSALALETNITGPGHATGRALLCQREHHTQLFPYLHDHFDGLTNVRSGHTEGFRCLRQSNVLSAAAAPLRRRRQPLCQRHPDLVVVATTSSSGMAMRLPKPRPCFLKKSTRVAFYFALYICS